MMASLSFEPLHVMIWSSIFFAPLPCYPHSRHRFLKDRLLELLEELSADGSSPVGESGAAAGALGGSPLTDGRGLGDVFLAAGLDRTVLFNQTLRNAATNKANYSWLQEVSMRWESKCMGKGDIPF